MDVFKEEQADWRVCNTAAISAIRDVGRLQVCDFQDIARSAWFVWLAGVVMRFQQKKKKKKKGTLN
jgi:hypothetical protein